jgi:hypothetical protein
MLSSFVCVHESEFNLKNLVRELDDPSFSLTVTVVCRILSLSVPCYSLLKNGFTTQILLSLSSIAFIRKVSLHMVYHDLDAKGDLCVLKRCTAFMLISSIRNNLNELGILSKCFPFIHLETFNLECGFNSGKLSRFRVRMCNHALKDKSLKKCLRPNVLFYVVKEKSSTF